MFDGTAQNYFGSLRECWSLSLRKERPIRILVADDHGVVRQGLKTILSNRPGWTVCAEASSGLEAINLAELFRPDVAVIDLNMPGVDGMEAIRQIKNKFPEIGIVVLTLYYSRQLLRDVSDAGARGYVMKSDADRDLVAAVDAVASGKTYLTPQIPEGEAAGGLPPSGQAGSGNRLDDREREAVRSIAQTMKKLL
jgi:DNA-binding NarL/FixJ family response regulator